MPSDKKPTPPRCERCGYAMTPAGRVPKVGPHPELLTYRCDDCGHVATVESQAHDW